MIRTQNAENLLVLWGEAQRGKPFIWGQTDCGSLVIKAAKILYGKPVFDISEYQDKKEAATVIKEIGSYEEFLGEYGAMQTDFTHMSAGDVLTGRIRNDWPTAMVALRQRFVLSSEEERGVFLEKLTEADDMKIFKLPYRIE